MSTSTTTTLGWALALAAALAAPGALAQAAAAAAPAAPKEVPAPAPAAKAGRAAAGDTMAGTAAWYGKKFNGRRTASGQRFDASALTAAHRTLPFGTRVRVTENDSKRSVVVVVNDRGPSTPGIVIDVTEAAARRLGFVRSGRADVTLEVVGPAAATRAKRG